jgi:vacuole morphology and inheritance protein 14
VQARHEKARRQALGADTSTISGFPELDKLSEMIGERSGRAPTTGRPPMRRRVTGGELPNPMSPAPVASKGGALSPLNPKARVPSGLTGIIPSQSGASVTSSNTNAAAALTQAQRQRRPIDLTRRA